jgi:hypothetical protein
MLLIFGLMIPKNATLIFDPKSALIVIFLDFEATSEVLAFREHIQE